MSRRLPLWGALVGVLLLAGCQSYKSVPFERSAEIRRIGLPTPAAPDRPEAMLASSVGQSFGLVGALIDAGMASERASNLDRILAAEGFDAQEEMSRALVAALEARGGSSELENLGISLTVAQLAAALADGGAARRRADPGARWAGRAAGAAGRRRRARRRGRRARRARRQRRSRPAVARATAVPREGAGRGAG